MRTHRLDGTSLASARCEEMLLETLLGAALLLTQSNVASGGPAWEPTQRLNRGFVVNGGEVAPFASDPRAGIDARGAALVVWSAPPRRGADRTDIYAASAPAGKAFAPARVVLVDADEPELAVLPDGRAMLTASRGTRDPDVLLIGTVDGRFDGARALGGRSDRVRALTATPQGAVALIGDRAAQRPDTRVREIDHDGAIAAARDVGLDDFDQRDQVTRGSDGTLAMAQGAQVVIRSPAGDWRRVRTPFGNDTADSQAGVAPDGRVSVAGIDVRDSGEASSYGGIVVAELPADARRFSPLRHLPVLPLDHPYAFGPVVAYDGEGHRVVGWVEDTHPDAGEEAETAFGRALASTSTTPRLALDPKAGDLRLLPTTLGVLSASDGGPWRSALLRGGTAQGLSGPAGRASPATFGTERGFATSAARTVLVWRGLPDGGIRAALLEGSSRRRS